MNKQNIIYVLSALAGIVFSACSDNAPNTSDQNNDLKYFGSSRNGHEIGTSTGVFGWNLLSSANNGKNNVVVSPFNAAMNLSMINNGIVGESQREVNDVLGFEEYDMADVNHFFNNMISNCPTADKHTKLKMANSLWISGATDVSSEIVATLTNDYFSEVYYSHDYKIDVKKWVSDHVGSGYDFNNVFEIGEDNVNNNEGHSNVHFMSVMDFAGKWQDEFDKKNTYKGTFTDISGKESKVNFMHQTYNGQAIFADTYTAVVMPMGNRQYNVIAVLPDKGIDMATCLADVADMWSTFPNACEGRTITISIPKFSARHSTSLIESLKKLGINALFAKDNGLKGFGTAGTMTFIDQISSFEIDEEGAKATSVGSSNASGLIEPSKNPYTLDIDFNRPFALAIYELSSQTLLMAAVINQL